MSTFDLIRVINPPADLAEVFAAAAADADALLAEITHLVKAGVGQEACARTEENLRLVRSNGGLDREQRIDQAIGERSMAEARSGQLRRYRKELQGLQAYFPELFPGAGSTIKAAALPSGFVLPALTQTACNKADLKPYEQSWRDFGKLPERDDPKTKRKFRTVQFAKAAE